MCIDLHLEALTGLRATALAALVAAVALEHAAYARDLVECHDQLAL